MSRTDEELAAAGRRLAGEPLAPVAELARVVPLADSPTGHADADTLVRWGTRGRVVRVYLDVVRGPDGVWMTSLAALERFFAAAPPDAPPLYPPCPPACRCRACRPPRRLSPGVIAGIAEKVLAERYVSVDELAANRELVTARGKTRTAGVGTLVRWIVEGVGGAHLEGFHKRGEGWITSLEALDRFAERTAALPPPGDPAGTGPDAAAPDQAGTTAA